MIAMIKQVFIDISSFIMVTLFLMYTHTIMIK